jgi:surfeit locus 1 family protein
MTDRAAPRFPVGLTLATAIGLAILIGLGVWQLQRLSWKQALLAHIEALRAAPAADIGPVLDAQAAGRDVDYTRVRARCPGLAAAPFLELYGLRQGQAGARLVSACAVASAHYRSVLVDRGFVADDVAQRPRVDPAATAPLELVGVLRKPERGNFVSPKNRPGVRWFTRDVAAMAASLNAPAPAPVFLFAETATNPEFPALVPAPLPTDIPNRHLEYAITWFGLAAALAGVYAAMLFKRGGS